MPLLPCPSLLQVLQGLQVLQPGPGSLCSDLPNSLQPQDRAPAVPPSGTPCVPGLHHLGPCRHSVLRLNATIRFKLARLWAPTPLPLGITPSSHFSVVLITVWSNEAHFFVRSSQCPARH